MDFKFALRSLLRSPAFTTLSILILALGIGANSAIFSVVYGVILRPLPYNHAEQLVAITTAWAGRSNFGQVSGPNFLDYQTTSDAFQAMSVFSDDILSVVANGKPESAGVTVVSSGFLKTMDVQPIAGRAFVATEFDGHPRVALVTQGFWRRHFNQAPFSAGHTLKAGGMQLEIIGLLPPSFHFPETSQTELWIPLPDVLKGTSRSAGNYLAVGRLKPNVTIEQAQIQLRAISARLAQAYPDSNRQASAYITPLNSYNVRQVKTNLYVLMGSVALVLLIACANIANLLLARGTGRIRELAIRTAIGASHARIVRQLLTETLILAAAGAVGGIFLASAIVPMLISMAPSFVPRLNDIHMDWNVLLCCGGTGVLSTLVFGLAPAWHSSRTDPNRDLRSGGARGVVGATSARWRQTFVTVEIALCLTLLISAGLMLRSFFALTSVDLGFHAENLLAAKISYSGTGSDAATQLVAPLLQKVSSAPGVRSAAITRSLPGESRSDVSYIISGQPQSALNVSAPSADISIISGSYFDTMGIRLLDGRTFSERDNATGTLNVVINQALAHQSFANTNPIGQKIFCGYTLKTMNGLTIVGIVADARLDGAKSRAEPEMYLPYFQYPQADMHLIVRTAVNPVTFAPSVRSLIQSLDTESTIKMTTMESHLATTVASPRFSSFLLSAFAGLAMLLATVGIYGVIAYSVSQRIGEIGLRMALGARQTEVLNMVLLEALKLAGAGLVIGLAGAVGAGRLLRSQLFEVSPSDPSVYLGMITLLLGAALVAAFLPAWRASRVDPLTALRQE